MWAQLVRLLAPIAVKAMAERMRVRNDHHRAETSDGRPADIDARLVELESQLDLQTQAHAKRIDEIAAALRTVGVRVVIALGFSVASLLVTFIVLVIALMKL